MKPQNSHPILGLDLIRFAAAAMVVFYHLTYWIGFGPVSDNFRISHGLFKFPQLEPFTNVGWVGVEIFFVLSGFVISFSSRNATPSKFLVGRFARLIPAAWICTTITLLVLILCHQETFPVLVYRWLRTMLFCPLGQYMDGAFWTLPIEAVFYAVMYAKLRLAKNLSFETVAVGLALWSGLFWAACLLIGPAAEGVRESRYGQVLLLHHGAEFALGIELCLMFMDRITLLRVVTAIVCVVITMAEMSNSAVMKHATAMVSHDVIYALGVWLVAMAAIIGSIKFNPLMHRLFGRYGELIRIIGLTTYPLYLLHQNVGAYIMYRAHELGLPAPLCLAAAIALVLATAVVIVLYLEPPARALIRKVAAMPMLAFLFAERPSPKAGQSARPWAPGSQNQGPAPRR